MTYRATYTGRLTTTAPDGTPIDLEVVEGEPVDLPPSVAALVAQSGLVTIEGDEVPFEAPPGAFDPTDHSVDEVNAYLDEHPGDAVTVLAAEAAGKNRKGIVEGPHAQTDAGSGDGNTDTTLEV